MTRFLITFTTVLSVMLILACNCVSSTNIGSTRNNSNDQAFDQDKESHEALIDTKILTPEFLFGVVELLDGKVSIKSVWVQDSKLYSLEKENRIIIEKQIQVDVMNCGGFIGSAIASYDANQFWNLEFLSDTIAADAIEKVKKCMDRSSGETKASFAVAVYPHKKNRKKIKTINKPDYKNILTSLSEDLRKWAGFNTSNHTQTKKELSKNIGNSWADIDGNGIIDLISISGKCNQDGPAICEIIMKFTNGKWKQVARVEPL